MLTAQFLRSVPKVQLHCHLEGTLRASTFVDLARKHGVALTYTPDKKGAFEAEKHHVDSSDPYAFRDFEGFLLTFAAVSRALAEPADYGLLAGEYLEDAIAQNVRYAELFISPSVWQFFHKDIDVRACVQEMRNAFDAAQRTHAIEAQLIVDLTRNFGAKSAMRTAELAIELQELGAIGVGLGGDEAHYPAELFVESFRLARARGLHCVAHAGEMAGAQSVRAAVEILHAERIGHGVRALEDRDTLKLLADKRIPLEICPTSNFLTGVALGEAPHPLLELDEAGCMVTIDADDPALFKTSITDELAYVAEIADNAAVRRFMQNAIDASFAPQETKGQLRELLDAAGLEA